jgi:hypothetical protein
MSEISKSKVWIAAAAAATAATAAFFYYQHSKWNKRSK